MVLGSTGGGNGKSTRKPHRIRSTTAVAITLGVALLFIYAGICKLLPASNFAADLSSFRLVPPFFVQPIAAFVPWLEVALGVSLLAKRTRYTGILALLFLMGLFTGAITSAYCRGLAITCGCFGSHANQTSYLWLFTRDIVILLLLVVIAKHELTARNAVAPTQEDAL